MNIRKGNLQDLQEIKNLALTVWSQFKPELTSDNWTLLHDTLSNEKIYADMLNQCDSFICENETNEIIGFSFLVPSGNPTEIFTEQQCYIRYVTVSEKYSGRKIGQHLTEKCIEKAIENGEKYIALHTSEMMHAARHIYEKLGFRMIKEIGPRLGKKYWVYQLEVGEKKDIPSI